MFESLSAARITMVTGVDTRLGFAAARRLAADGAAVILHAHDKEHAEEALEALVQTGIPVARLHIVHADFSKLTEVDELAATLAATVPCLHALINAASVPGGERRSRTADGYETTLQINYLAPQRLIAALAPAVAAARGRVVTVSSPLHLNWSAADSAFVALSDQYPDLVCHNPWSSLAAIDGLLDMIEEHCRGHRSADRPAA
ncbi:SDR family NAD(P)-dependent oxidoreductase [Nocardia amikacinitolerans]|uniref:SDR family NAD(P)-dependent oxidoreductase n=1 Tax=Nocardia amikacinitolerans TaxID=756689 RepID=UPI0036C667FD